MTIVAGVVQPDYDECSDSPVGSIEIPGPAGPQGPPGEGSLCPLFCGTGSPEGVVTSPIGGIYEQTDAAATSHSVWFKNSGVGNTGWRQWAGLRGGDGANTALRIGNNSIATGVDAVAIGENAEATGVSAVALGKNTLASGARSEAFGQDSEATGDDSKAFGAGALATADRAIALGQGAVASAMEAIAIGDESTASALEALAVGSGSNAAAAGALAVGASAQATGLTSIAVGSGSAASATSALAVGENAVASGLRSTAVGYTAQATKADAVALGDTVANSIEQVNIGYQNVIKINDNNRQTVVGQRNDNSTETQLGGTVIIGELNTVAHESTSEPLIVIGQFNLVKGAGLVAIGAFIEANDGLVGGITDLGYPDFGVMIGNGVIAQASCFVAIGDGAEAYGVNAAALGMHAQAGLNKDSNDTTALGSFSTATADWATALGASATADQIASIALGYRANSNAANQLMIGHSDVGAEILGVHFNGSATPAIIVDASGNIQLAGGVAAPIAGGGATPTNVISSNSTITIDATAGAHVVNLPSIATASSGKMYFFKKIDASANTVTITPNGADTIEDAATLVLAVLGDSVIIQSDNVSNWIILA